MRNGEVFGLESKEMAMIILQIMTKIKTNCRYTASCGFDVNMVLLKDIQVVQMVPNITCVVFTDSGRWAGIFSGARLSFTTNESRTEG